MKSLFWDGRAEDLVQQARAPLINPVEHAFTEESELVRIVRADTYYSTELARLWPASSNNISMQMITEALAEYERTLLAGGSTFDRFYYAKDPGALSDAAARGLELFRGRGNCVSCHPIGEQSSLFTDHEFHVAARGLRPAVNSNLAVLAQRAVAAKNSSNQQELERLIATDAQIAALGRFLVTLDPADIGKFKTPSLRNVALTAPYMHVVSGILASDEIVARRHYPIILTRAEKATWSSS